MPSTVRKKMATAGLILITGSLLISMALGFAREAIPALSVLGEFIGQGLTEIKG